MGSTRLPGKVMADLGGKPVLAWVVDAAKKAKRVDEVWVATDHSSPSVVDWCAKRCNVFLGDEYNVLSRFQAIDRMTKPDLIVRLTADCPFVDHMVIDKCIKIAGASTEQWPDGMDVQVFEPALLYGKDTHLEHVISPDYKFPQLPCPQGNRRHIRMTLDTADDLEHLRALAGIAA